MGIPAPTTPPTGGFGPLDGKKIVVHTPQEWAKIVEAARSGKNFDLAQVPMGVSPDLGKPEGAL